MAVSDYMSLVAIFEIAVPLTCKHVSNPCVQSPLCSKVCSRDCPFWLHRKVTIRSDSPVLEALVLRERNMRVAAILHVVFTCTTGPLSLTE